VKRRIEETEARKTQLDYLAKSDRAVLLMGFQSLFLQLGLVSFVFFLQVVLSPEREGFNILKAMVMLLWGILAGVFFYLADLIRTVDNYPKSLETIEKKIAKLKSKLRGGRGDEKV
jgi:hypothetical protein